MAARFTLATELEVSAERAFAWHSRPGAFERLVPPWQKVRVVERRGGIRDGGRMVLDVRLGGLLWTRWVAEHFGHQRGRQFCDRQVEGPFRSWEHRHVFEPLGDGRCRLVDELEYEPPLGAPGRLLCGPWTQSQLRRMFQYRHSTTIHDLELHARFEHLPRRVVAITGGSGLIGTALNALLTTGGHLVVQLVRHSPRGPDEVQWDPQRGVLDPACLSGVDAVVHLAGENIASGRWTARRRAAIRDSRVLGTRALLASLAAMPQPPKTVVVASAVGIYGDRGDIELDEQAPAGSGFLADVCKEWESEAAAAQAWGARRASVRLGVVLSPAGGMLAKLLPVFKAGMGGPVGSGAQYMPWISIDDAVGSIYHALLDERLQGPINVVAPQVVTNRQFTEVLGRVLKRPTLLRVPTFAARVAFGQMADEAILASARAVPSALQRHGYVFRHPELEPALRHLLGIVRS